MCGGTATRPAAAQRGMLLGHGFASPPEARALHVRIGLADAAAVASVGAVDLGRIEIRAAEALFGSVPPRFALKRAPSDPPPFAEGDRVLLLLRGARSPYLLVDESHEVIRLGDAEAEATWRDAVLSVSAARSEPRTLAGLYLAWLEGSSPPLRAAAVAGLRHGLAPFRPLTPGERARLSALATDPDAPAEARRGAAAVAALEPGSRRALLAALPGGPDGADAEVLRIGLRASALARDPGTNAAVLRSLGHPDPAVRRIGLEFGSLARVDPALRARLEIMAGSEPDTTLRDLAAATLGAIDRGGPSRATH